MKRAQYGFTLVELMVAVSIALFLIGGLLTIVQNTRNAYSNQSRLAQMQDAERLAMIMMTDVIQSAGYFPNPVAFNAASLPAAGAFAVGQSINGTHTGVAAPGDALAVRYLTQSGDGVLNCHGTSNSSGGTLLYTNTFSVNASQQLVCDPGDGSGALPLVSGVQNLQLVYGVKRNFALAGNDVDTYLTADQLTAADWQNVTSVRVTLTFVNPLFGAPGQPVNQPATMSFQRVVDPMARASESQ
jgi:type IV pilus assembly protein PilW